MASCNEGNSDIEENNDRFGVGNYAKRKRNSGNWEREKQKKNRNSARAYKNYKGEEKLEKHIGQDCKCRKKCFEVVPQEVRENLFLNYFNLQHHDLQNSYVSGCINVQNVKRRYVDDAVQSRRQSSCVYSVMHDQREVQICKKAFQSIHALSNGRVSRIISQKKANGTPKVRKLI